MNSHCKAVGISFFLGILRRQRFGVVFITLLATSLMTFQAWNAVNHYKYSITLRIKSDSLRVPSDFNLALKDEFEERKVVLQIYSQMESELNPDAMKSLIKNNNLFQDKIAKGISPDEIVQDIHDTTEISNIVLEDNHAILFIFSYVDDNEDDARNFLNALSTQIARSSKVETGQTEILVIGNESHQIIYPNRCLMILFGLLSGLFIGISITSLIGFIRSLAILR